MVSAIEAFHCIIPVNLTKRASVRNEQKQQPQIDWHKLQAEYYLNAIVCQKYYNEYYHKGVCFDSMVTSVSSPLVSIIKHSRVTRVLALYLGHMQKAWVWGYTGVLLSAFKFQTVRKKVG